MSSFRQITTFSATFLPDNSLSGGSPHIPRRGLCAKSRPGAGCSILPLHRLDAGILFCSHF